MGKGSIGVVPRGVRAEGPEVEERGRRRSRGCEPRLKRRGDLGRRASRAAADLPMGER